MEVIDFLLYCNLDHIFNYNSERVSCKLAHKLKEETIRQTFMNNVRNMAVKPHLHVNDRTLLNKDVRPVSLQGCNMERQFILV